MSLHPLFQLNEKASDDLLALLDGAVLGTNGAQYRHLDAAEKLAECDDPLHLSLIRKEKTMGNISFCRRGDAWYLRYFAFNALMPSSGARKSRSSGFLKAELHTFFDDVLKQQYSDTPVNALYAYIDPNNAKSLWMSEGFGFEKVAILATQTFSRMRPISSSRLVKMTDWSSVQDAVRTTFDSYRYYFEAQVAKGPFYALKDEDGSILALAKIDKAHWEIKRLPGKFGGMLTKIIPWIPGLNKIIRPKNHRFIVPEAVIVRDNSPQLLAELLEGILAAENEQLLIWWVDEQDALYHAARSSVKWGFLHRLIGASAVNVMAKQNGAPDHRPVYTSGIDLI